MSDVLAQIIKTKHAEVAAAKKATPIGKLEVRVKSTPPVRSFEAAIRAPGIRVIAECKSKSPSKGIMLHNYNPVALGRSYEAGGCAAISVLTDRQYFGGSLADLVAVRSSVGVPCLRKDFIIDPYQIFETRAHGADSFLLLAGVLDAKTIEEYLTLGRRLGLEPLVESHNEEELEIALATSARILGINNRDLKSFTVDLNHSKRLLAMAQRPGGAATAAEPRIVVCESGIKNRSDVEMMTGVGYKVFLIGESLATSPHPQSALQDLIAGSR